MRGNRRRSAAALVGDRIPVLADRLIEALVKESKSADQGDGSDDQEGDADLLAVPLEISRQYLAF